MNNPPKNSGSNLLTPKWRLHRFTNPLWINIENLRPKIFNIYQMGGMVHIEANLFFIIVRNPKPSGMGRRGGRVYPIPPSFLRPLSTLKLETQTRVGGARGMVSELGGVGRDS